MKTVAISANTSWYLYNFRRNTITALLDAGYQVVAIAPKDDYSPKLESLGASFCHINIDQGVQTLLKILVRFSHLSKSLRASNPIWY